MAVRYLRLGNNDLRLSSITIISCSINFNVMEEVFKKSYTYFKDGPYFMGSSDTLLIVLIKKGNNFWSYEQLDDYHSIKQSELLPHYTKLSILEHYKIIEHPIINIYVVEAV